jgi:PIN domain nuclease of toxin-antitoxin system
MRLLLDTCVLLWLGRGDPSLPETVRKALSRPDAELVVSVASAWEIAIKHARGRLPLPVPLDRFLPMLRERHGLSSLPIDEESALHVAKLPLLHVDPFDRMLVSQAIVHGLTIVTPDPLVTPYPARTMW